jgi:hypothetical protein
MAHVSRQQRNGKVRYLARYTDPSGRERAKSFTRKKDAERFLTGIENDKLRVPGPTRRSAESCLRIGMPCGVGQRWSFVPTPRPETSGCSDSTSSPASGRCHWLRSPSTRCALGSPTRPGKD